MSSHTTHLSSPFILLLLLVSVIFVVVEGQYTVTSVTSTMTFDSTTDCFATMKEDWVIAFTSTQSQFSRILLDSYTSGTGYRLTSLNDLSVTSSTNTSLVSSFTTIRSDSSLQIVVAFRNAVTTGTSVQLSFTYSYRALASISGRNKITFGYTQPVAMKSIAFTVNLPQYDKIADTDIMSVVPSGFTSSVSPSLRFTSTGSTNTGQALKFSIDYAQQYAKCGSPPKKKKRSLAYGLGLGLVLGVICSIVIFWGVLSLVVLMVFGKEAGPILTLMWLPCTICKRSGRYR